MTPPRILSVGQCGYDHRHLANLLGTRLSAQVTPADDFGEALNALRADRYDLVLVNRITDGDGSAGLDLIRTLKAEPALAAVPVMLVSDLPQAQTDAVALGACAGFGKSELSRPQTLDRIRAVLTPLGES